MLCMALAMPSTVKAQDALDDALEGFDKTPKAVSTDDPLDGFDAPSSMMAPTQHAAPSPWSVSGSVSFSAAYDYTQNAPTAGSSDKRGLSRARPKANLKLKGNLPDQFPLPVRVLGEASVAHDLMYTVRGRGDYNATVLNSFEHDLNLGELYASAQLGRGFEITAGRQTIVWGTSENLRVVDVINPLDRRELGMVDIEDVRLPLGMVRGDYTAGPWSASALVIPHIRFNKTAPSYSPYDTANGAAPQNDVPSDGLDNAEFAARLKGTFSGWDLSLHTANLYDDSGHKETVNGTTRIRHERVNMVGISGDVALGNWLVRGEAASFSGLQTLGVPSQDFTRADTLAGVDFTGLPDASMSFEVVNRHLFDWSPALIGEGLKENSQEYALRFSGDYMHDRVHVTALTTRISPLTKGGGFSRASVEYDIQDALSITGGVTLYHDGTHAPFKGLGDNDRIFVEIKQSF